MFWEAATLTVIITRILATLLRMPAFHDGPLSQPFPSQAFNSASVLSLHRVLLAYYRLLQVNRALPRTLGWSLTPLSQLIWTPHPDNGVRFLAIRCYALQAGMMEGERTKIEKEVLGEVSQTHCRVAFGFNPDGSVHETDGWVLPVLEVERIARCRSALVEPHDYYAVDETDSCEPIHPAELR